MPSPRNSLLHWAEQNRLAPERLADAFALVGVTPHPTDWRRFLDRLLLWSGATFLALAIIFFLAYNWHALGRFGKFALVEAFLLAALIGVWKFGVDRPSGKATLLAASLALGGLLALFGQTYQTGADPWELFAHWALLMLPWAATARFAPLWILWLGLLNIALALHQSVFHGFFGVHFSMRETLLLFFLFNTFALITWEWAAQRWDWLAGRWPPRLIAVASSIAVTTLALNMLFDKGVEGGIALLWHPLWLALGYGWYRKRQLDLFMLAAGSLSLIVVVTGWLAKHLLDRAEAIGALFIALAVIGMSAYAALWLKSLAKEVKP